MIFRLATMAILAATLSPSFANAQTAGTFRDVQFRSIDFENQVVELYNFGADNQTLDGWRICTHDEATGFRYTSSTGLNGQSLAAGASLFIDWDNNGSGGSTLDVSTLGGGWIGDLLAGGTGEAVTLGLYNSNLGGFGTSAAMADHIQYSFGGANITGANNRIGPALGANLWGSAADWISIDAASTGILMNAGAAFPGAAATQSASSFSVSAVPEPTAFTLLAFGAAVITVVHRRRA